MSAAPPPPPPQTIKLSLPLDYQQTIFQELRAQDELVILGRGLGLMRLLTNLLHSYDAAGNNLILVVGATDRENIWLGEALAEHAAVSPPVAAAACRGLTVVNTDFTSVAARERMYATGGIFSVTSRILVVDLLTSLLNPTTITGVVVLHADRVAATSLEAFILRIYRQRNRAGFLKAFSDAPDAFFGSAAGTGGASAGADGLGATLQPLTSALRNLFLRKVSLWPRFQVSVAQSLEARNRRAEVIELEVPMTDTMRDIQAAILDCVEVSIHELKRDNSGLLDMDGWNLDGALRGNFDLLVRRQLDPHWHRLSWKTRQIVGDLSVLRGLLTSLLTLDAVDFMQHIDTIHAAHAPAPGSTRQSQSPWLFLESAQIIFETARRRVYASSGVRKKKKAGKTPAKSDAALRPVLEELPKWALLADILEEIDRTLHFEPPPRDDSYGTILIMCSSTDICRQIRDYLKTMHIKPKRDAAAAAAAAAAGTARRNTNKDTNSDTDDSDKTDSDDSDDDEDRASGAFLMRRKLRNYLAWKGQFARVNASLYSENQKALNGAVDPRLRGTAAGSSSSSNNNAGRGAPSNTRRRVRGGGSGTGLATTPHAGSSSAPANNAHPLRADNGSVAQYFEKANEVAELMANMRATDQDIDEQGPPPAADGVAGMSNAVGASTTTATTATTNITTAHINLIDVDATDADDDNDFYQLYDMQDLVVVHAYDGDADEQVLDEVRPRYIVMYEPDAAFIRRVEVYRSSHSDRAVRVYFMFYGSSVEEQRYLAAVRREKDSFTRLIRERASMSLVLATDAEALGGSGGSGGGDASSGDPQEAFLRTVNTRIAGGGRIRAAGATTGATAEPPRVVVDVREFRSALPSLLHARGITVVPCMLTVGDYVLSGTMCVERKSVADLIASFRDGRLYAQAEAMSRHYRTVVLLIEFGQDKSFTLEPFVAGGQGSGGGGSGGGAGGSAANTTSPDLQGKIAMLTLAFPTLRIVWSSSPYQTAEIFETLKRHEDEPDPLTAVRMGLDSDMGNAGGGAIEQQVLSQEPRDMLAAVPGVTAANAGLVVAAAENLREVANMEVEELAKVVGREAAGKMHRFFTRNVVAEG